MQDYFYATADFIQSLLQTEEIFTCSFSGEQSDFVRFNHARIRQAGCVNQSMIHLDLICGRRHSAATLTLSGYVDHDRARLRALIDELRELRTHVPEDPHLLYATDIHSSESISTATLPESGDIIGQILNHSQHQDLVGILASGSVYKGFANSLGQRNWHARNSFNMDWSLYLHSDKAVKARYAGFHWSENAFATHLQRAEEQLAVMKKPARTLEPGSYRAYLTPMALEEIVELLGWGGFSLRARHTGQTPLLRLIEQDEHFHSGITLSENTADGVAPQFQAAGFIRPDRVPLIEQGRFAGDLVSPRSALEYNIPCNGADIAESPLSLDMAAGELMTDDILTELNTGLYIGNLWYLNYSDLNAARITGMTRFATFWVERGRIQAPVNALRFDETLYNLFGKKLIKLTREREMLLDPGTYGARSSRSARLPGLLVEDMRFTL